MAKTVKLKTPRQLEELIELFEWKMSLPSCSCLECQTSRMIYECAVTSLSWALGNKPKHYIKLIDALKHARENKTKQQHSHAE